jgi:hypothetical protein
MNSELQHNTANSRSGRNNNFYKGHLAQVYDRHRNISSRDPSISLFEGRIVRTLPMVMELRWEIPDGPLLRQVESDTGCTARDRDIPGWSRQTAWLRIIIIWGSTEFPVARIAFPHHDEVHSRPRWNPFQRTHHPPTTNAIEVDISAQTADGFPFQLPQKFNCRVTVFGFPRGRVTLLMGTVIDWFTPVSHTKYAHIITEDFNKEL